MSPLDSLRNNITSKLYLGQELKGQKISSTCNSIMGLHGSLYDKDISFDLGHTIFTCPTMLAQTFNIPLPNFHVYQIQTFKAIPNYSFTSMFSLCVMWLVVYIIPRVLSYE